MQEVYILSAVRTAIGSFGGALKDVSATQLGAAAIKGAVEKASIDAALVEDVLMGSVIQANLGQAPARQAAKFAGLPNEVNCTTINKVCASGMKAIAQAAQSIMLGDADIVVAGGMESMSQAPHIAKGLRNGQKLGDIQLTDAMVFDGLTCAFDACHMGMHAEHIAKKFNVTRNDQDQFSLQSQQRAVAAIAAGHFAKELVPVTIKSRKGDLVVGADEGPRGDTSLDGLAKLRPVFDKDGSVTAGNASTLSDGAAAVLVCDLATAASASVKFKILASHTAGTEPRDLFIAPVFAVEGALKKCGLGLADIDLFEINEAFASQMVACIKELKADPARVNVSGGGISLGHPIGASGARVLVTLMHALTRTGKKRGVASLCLGGGNAVAMVIEAC